MDQARQPLTPRELASQIDVPAVRCTRAANLLEQAGMLTTDTSGRLRYRPPADGTDGAVTAAVRIAENRRQFVRSRIEMLRGYAETTGCRRQLLLGYFGQQLDEPCGNCDSCDAGDVRDGDDGADVGDPSVTPFGANSQVRHDSWGDGIVMSAANDRLTVLFDAVGYKTLSTKAIQDGILWRPLTHGAA